mgnify:CR=1 FL=1
MFKNTFITLTVSLLIFGLLSVIRPQNQEIETAVNQPVAIAQTEQQDLVDPNETELVVKEFFVEVEEVKEEVEEVKVEVKVEQPKVETKVEQPKVETKAEQPKVETKVEQPKTEVKVAAPKTEVKVEQPKEEQKDEVKSEPVEQAPVQEQKAEPAPAPAPVVTVSSSPAATWELEIARLTNIERQKAGLSILKYNTSLEAGAKIRAQEIITHFSHTRPDGSRFFTAFGDLQYQNIGENLGSGFRTPESIVNAWMNSESHRANILKPEYQEISVAITKDADGKYRWVQIFYRGR